METEHLVSVYDHGSVPGIDWGASSILSYYVRNARTLTPLLLKLFPALVCTAYGSPPCSIKETPCTNRRILSLRYCSRALECSGFREYGLSGSLIVHVLSDLVRW